MGKGHEAVDRMKGDKAGRIEEMLKADGAIVLELLVYLFNICMKGGTANSLPKGEREITQELKLDKPVEYIRQSV